MKSFFQLAEQARKHQRKKLLREADGDQAAQEAEPAKAAANQQIQNNQNPNQEPKSVSYAEIPDVDLVTEFQKKLKNLAEDKATAAALVKMKEIPATQAFATAFTNAQAELLKAVSVMQKQDQEEKSGNKPDANAGSNSAGSGASPPPPAAKPAAPPTQAPPA